MNAHLMVIRAVGAEFLRRKYIGIVITYIVVFIVSAGVLGWLVSLSEWWWILAVIIVPFLILVGAALFFVRAVMKRLRPALTTDQTKRTKAFVDKMERVAEHVQTPMFMILFRIVVDVIRPSEKTFIESVAQDSSTLHADFLELRKHFL